MLLGKRPRNPMKRTTSMSAITLDLNTSTDVVEPRHNTPCVGTVMSGFNGLLDQSNNNRMMMATDSPKIQRRHSTNCVEDTPDFLRACSLCKRAFVPGRDIYMYRGDSGFCSLECRQQQMKRDDRKGDKYVVASSRKQVVPPSSSRSQVPKKAETVAAL